MVDAHQTIPTAKLKALDVAHVAHLARLRLTPQEQAQYTPQLTAILNYVALLQQVDTSGVTPIGQITGLTNVLQADLPAADSVNRDDFLTGAPVASSPYLKARSVLE